MKNKVLFDDCFDIVLFVTDDPMDLLSGCQVIKRINCTRNVFAWSPVTIEADPFLAVKDDTLYLFYEEYYYRGKGVIKATSTGDLVNWTKPWTVLEEDFHLSYPYVFQHDGEWYMIPETSAVHEVRLYKAVNNEFNQFVQVGTLLRHHSDDAFPLMDYCDSSIIEKNGVFYLFTTLNHGKENELHLYCSDTFDGNYLPHPQSPIIVGNDSGRNGGSLLKQNGVLYRFAQNCEGEYGKNISVFRVFDLSPARYDEIAVIKDAFTQYGLSAGHQYNFVKFKDKNIVAIDQKRRIPFIGCKVKRLLQLLFK